MRARLRSWWQPRRKYWVVAVIIAFLAVGMVIFLGYWLKWDWTGFNGRVGPNVQQYQPAKTLWDWLNLLGVLAIPAAVGLGTMWFTRQQAKVSDAENKDNQRETALQAYMDKMSELLLEKQLRESAEDDEVRTIARVRTLTVLRRLDASRKASVLQFLYESGLIEKGKSIIDLSGADLSDANLLGADLSNARLAEANLGKAVLHTANLLEADLSNARLAEAFLLGANLSGADLSNADLVGAFLRGAKLSDANLVGAFLSGAQVTQEQLKQAKSLKGAVMPDGSKHT